MALPKLLLVVLLLAAQSEVTQHSLYSDKLSFSLPSSFKSAPVRAGDGNDARFIDDPNRKQIDFALSPEDFPADALPETLRRFEEEIKKQRKFREWIGSEIVEVNGRSYGILTFKRDGLGGATVERWIISPFDGRLLQIFMMTPENRLEQLKPLTTDLLNSIEVR